MGNVIPDGLLQNAQRIFVPYGSLDMVDAFLKNWNIQEIYPEVKTLTVALDKRRRGEDPGEPAIVPLPADEMVETYRAKMGKARKAYLEENPDGTLPVMQVIMVKRY